jgi:hypothetical protein
MMSEIHFLVVRASLTMHLLIFFLLMVANNLGAIFIILCWATNGYSKMKSACSIPYLSLDGHREESFDFVRDP